MATELPADRAPGRPQAPAAPAAWPKLAWSWADQAAKGDGFQPSKAAEQAYFQKMNSVAGRIRQIVAGGGDPDRKVTLLRAYSVALGDWAQAAAATMLQAAVRKNDQIWMRQADKIGSSLRDHLTATGSGPSLQKMIDNNAALIRSLPEGAANRIADLTGQALVSGMRPETLASRIQEAADIEEARARTIARTEVSKANTALTRQRCDVIGSEGYIWRTSRDGGVRHSHAAMEGKFVRWDDPPTLDGYTAHAGEFVNCRCYPEPVIPRQGAAAAPPAARRFVASPIPTAASTGGRPTFLSHWEKNFAQVVPHRAGLPLPGADQATVSIDKLAGYALKNENKARVFAAALGMDTRHAADLQRQLQDGVRTTAAARSANKVDQHGERFRVKIPVTGPNGQTVEVETGWIYDRQDGRQSETPRLVTAFVAGDKPRGS